ncbi:MAG: hypothetical protein WCW77_03840 [Patescibacteria group bacterium]|jgi:hypothetical protein
MKIDQGFQKLGDYLTGAKNPRKKPPAYEWQDLALKVIKLLNIPAFKKNSVFKAVKDYPKSVIVTALNDTLELCQTGEKWKYFFKVLASPPRQSLPEESITGGEQKKALARRPRSNFFSEWDKKL